MGHGGYPGYGMGHGGYPGYGGHGGYPGMDMEYTRIGMTATLWKQLNHGHLTGNSHTSNNKGVIDISKQQMNFKQNFKRTGDNDFQRSIAQSAN